jgi:hypothetical protein
MPVPKLTVDDLLTGSRTIHELEIPPAVLTPGHDAESDAPLACVRLRPLSVGILTLISRAARDDASLAPLLMIKEAMLEPTLSLDHIRQMHIGLVYYLVSRINRISGLDGAVETPLERMHICSPSISAGRPTKSASSHPVKWRSTLPGSKG